MESKFEKLFKELVPREGKCDSLAGELVRAASRLEYRFYNDGDMVNHSYGKETCNPAARFLLEKGSTCIKGLVQGLWEVTDENAYEAILKSLTREIASYIEQRPDLRNMPTEDMFDYRHPDEDIDYSWMEDESDEE